MLAFSIITAKSLNGELRQIEGWATTPTPDRVGDVIAPEGVQSAPDIPLFLHHDSTKTVGRAVLGTPSSKGIPFRATLPIISEPGPLRDMVDTAWLSVKHGLITGVSIGFRALDGAVEAIRGGGTRYLKTEVMELSLVPLPCNSEAAITAAKSVDHSSSEAVALIRNTVRTRDAVKRQALAHHSNPSARRPGCVYL
jgi:HK97 family phage prohead protease